MPRAQPRWAPLARARAKEHPAGPAHLAAFAAAHHNRRMDVTPLAQPFAFISDIHGNLPALEAVLAELRRRDVGRIYAVGEHLLADGERGGQDPLGVWRLLQKNDVVCIRGLSDEALIEVDEDSLAPHGDEEHVRADAFLKARKDLGELVIEQLRRLPLSLRIPLIDGREVFVVHGSPADPFTAIEHHMSDEEIERALAGEAADVVVCGASHTAFRRDIEDVALVSVGSVGAAPTEGIAHYCIMSPRMDGLEVALEHLELPG